MILQVIAVMTKKKIARTKKMMKMQTMKKNSVVNQVKMKKETRVCKIQMTNAKQENKRKNKLRMKMKKVTNNQKRLDARGGQIDVATALKMK